MRVFAENDSCAVSCMGPAAIKYLAIWHKDNLFAAANEIRAVRLQKQI